MDERASRYAAALAQMIQLETVSSRSETERIGSPAFRALVEWSFPNLFAATRCIPFADGFVLHWQGADPRRPPVLFMNHHDVVEAEGGWTHSPFAGEIADGRLWGRGTLDDKGGLWAMLQAADELAEEGFRPGRDLWFASSCTEETTGAGAAEIAAWFEEQGIRFEMSFDEGGMIVSDPIEGVHGTFAMVGVGEKGCADIRFSARSGGGHASTPEADTPLVRLGKFMAAADKSDVFEARFSPTACEMLRRFAPYTGKAAALLRRSDRFSPLLAQVFSRRGGAAAALVRTTIAFTMAQGSPGTNVLPQEAWVVGNMRFSHHQGRESSLRAVETIAQRYGVEMEVLDPGFSSGITDWTGSAFTLTERAVTRLFPGTVTVPYVMTGASDSRFFDRICGQCIRFLPLPIDGQQLASIHGVDENVGLADLAPAVDYYRCLMQEV